MQDDAGLIAALSGAVGRHHVATADDDQEPYLVDWRGRYHGRAVAVVKPASTEEVAEVVRIGATEPGGAAPLEPGSAHQGLCRARRLAETTSLDGAPEHALGSSKEIS